MATTKKTRAPRQKVDRSNETASQKFVRLAEARLTKAVKALRGLKNLGGRAYERGAEDCKAIKETLAAEVKAVNDALTPHVPGSGSTGEKKTEGPVLKLSGK